MKYESLFQPILINQLMLKNRIFAAPLTDGAELPEKMKCGAAVNIMGCVAVDHKSARWFGSPDPFSKEQRLNTRKMLDFYKSGGSFVSAELMHCGYWNRGSGVYGPNDEINPEGVKVKGLTVEELSEIADSFGRTAANAKEFGFDMVMLHFAHGWLIPQFLSPSINRRTDEYGGSYENRARFPLECVKKVREAVGPDYPVDMRISAEEWTKDGMKFEEVLRFLKDCEPYLDMVNISAGTDMDKEGSVHMTASAFERHCTNIDYAKKVKETLSVPVCVVGSIMTPEEADSIIRKGYADMVAIGRPLLADPDWIKKAAEGREEDIVPCLRCTYCMHWSTERKGQNCSVNVRAFKENFVPCTLPKAERSKKIVVAGAGPAGMRAALTAAERGHRVLLYEQEEALGGLLKHADYEQSKQDLKRYKDYLIRQINKSRVEVHLNTTVTPELIKSLCPDEVILALGSKAFTPPITGKEYAIPVLEAYPKLDDLGEQIVIIGGGTIGCELGLELEARGRKVTILEMSGRLHRQDSLYYDIAIEQHIQKAKNLTCLTQAKVLEIKEGEVIYQNAEGRLCKEVCDQIIMAAGLRSRREEAHAFYEIKEIPIHMIGDCGKVGKVREANETAYYTASAL